MKSVAIYADHRFNWLTAKTAFGILRYHPDTVVAIIDREHAGSTVSRVTEFDLEIPIVAGVQEAMEFGPDALLIGVAPHIHVVPDRMREQVAEAVRSGLDIISGLHTFFSEMPDIAELARSHNSQIHDVRRAPDFTALGRGDLHREGTCTIMTVGSDCCLGKKTTALEMHHAALADGWSSAFLATGQTGILIEGDGVPVDRMITDFLTGIVEHEVLRRLEKADWLFVEGQGALNHPGASNTPMGLISGSRPDLFILCHDLDRTHLAGYPKHPIPPLGDLIAINEEASRWGRTDGGARVAGISLVTKHLTDRQARAAIEQVESELGLPTADPIRFGVAPLISAVRAAHGPNHGKELTNTSTS